jgi:DNA-directed RNA polymerase specialized sigma24 family protein
MTTPASDERSDQELLRAHVDGDPDAFGELFARHRTRLWAVALRTMGNPDDAADGLQDGMVAAFRRAGSFRGEAAVTTWLHRVVVNACLDRLRAAKIPTTSTTAGPWSRPPPATTGPTRRPRSPSAAAGSSTRSPPFRPSSGPRSSSSTWRATRSPRSPRCWAAPRAP